MGMDISSIQMTVQHTRIFVSSGLQRTVGELYIWFETEIYDTFLMKNNHRNNPYNKYIYTVAINVTLSQMNKNNSSLMEKTKGRCLFPVKSLNKIQIIIKSNCNRITSDKRSS